MRALPSTAVGYKRDTWNDNQKLQIIRYLSLKDHELGVLCMKMGYLNETIAVIWPKYFHENGLV